MATLGKDHPSVATTRADMGMVYSEQSKFADALREYEEALRIEMAALGKNHPEVATTRSNMASVYSKQSKLADALREYEEALLTAVGQADVERWLAIGSARCCGCFHVATALRCDCSVHI